MSDDYPATTATTATVAVGGSATGEIETADDRDWFSVEFTAGKHYRIDLEGAPTHAGSLWDPLLAGIHDSEGNLIADTEDRYGGTGRNARLLFTATETGTHYIAAALMRGDPGTYRLSVTEIDAPDIPASTATTATLDVGGSATGEIETQGDRDWFAVTLERGRIYQFDMKGRSTGDGTLEDPYFRAIYNSSGKQIHGEPDNDGGEGRNARLVFTARESATHYVSARAYDGGTGTYTLSVTDLGEAATEPPVDIPGTTATTATIEVDGSTTSDIWYHGDRDWFAVELQAGVTYRFDMKGISTGDGTLLSPILHGIHDAEGNLIAGTRDGNGSGIGWNSLVRFSAAETGTHYIAAGSHGSVTGTYRISVTALTDDHSGSAATTATVSVGGTATGNIGFTDDRDWFAVQLEAGVTYRIDLEGDATRNGTLLNPYLRGIHDADGNLIGGTTNDNGGKNTNSRLFFTATETGAHYISAGARGNGTGTYRLSVNDATDDHPADTTTTAIVDVGGQAIGEIEVPGDRDWFAVDLEAGRTYGIHLRGRSTDNGTLPDPYLHGVHDPAGNLIPGTADDDGGYGRNSWLYFTATESGTHFVNAGGAGTGTYTLSVWQAGQAVDDHPADTTTSATVDVGGQATGEIEVPGDRDWFAVELEADTTYRIDLEGRSTDDGTLPDPYLHGVHDPDGKLIPGTANDDGGYGGNSWKHFTATESGTHFIEAGGTGTGTYTLTVATTVTDDHPASASTTATVAVGGFATGVVDFVGDRDWFAVALEAGVTYRFDLEGSETGAGTLRDPHLRGIHDAQGNLVPGTSDNDGGEGSNARLEFTATETGTHYVSAGGFGGATGAYRLTVTATGGTGTEVMGQSQESVADTTQAAQQQSGTPETDEEDTEGATQTAQQRSETPEAAEEETEDTEDTIVLAPPVAVFVPAQAEADDGEGSPPVAAEQRSGDGDPPGATTTVTVDVGDTASGEIETSGERDWFAVELVAGVTYRFDLGGRPTEDGTLADPHLHGIHDPQGNPVPGAADADGGEGPNARLEFTATETGTHHVVAGANGGGTGTFTLSVREIVMVAEPEAAVPADDHPADTTTSATVAVGGSVDGEIEVSGERDWFAVELEEGVTYRLDLEGSKTGAGTLRDPWLRGIHDAQGRLVAGTSDDDGGEGWNARLELTATETGTHYVAAGGHGGGTGSYRLGVAEARSPEGREEGAQEGAPVDDGHPADATTTATVEVGGTATGEVEAAHDRDWFAVELEAGVTYRFDLEGSETGAGTLRDPHLRGIHDSEGELIAGTTDDDGGHGWNSRLEFTATETGTHYVAAGANASGTGAYALSVSEVERREADPAADVPADATTAATVEVGGTATGEVEAAHDRDWLAVDLKAGVTYRFDLEGAATEAGTLADPHLHGVHGPSGKPVPGTEDDDGGEGLNARLEFTARETGTHHVVAGAGGSGTGAYTLSVSEAEGQGTDDVPADATTTATVAVGGSAAGEIGAAHDRDWYAVELEEGVTYRFDLEGSETGTGTLSDPYLRGVHDAQGDLIPGTTDDDGGAGFDAKLLFTATETGIYYVAAGAYGSGTGAYTLSVSEAGRPETGPAADVPAAATTAATVDVGGSATGEIGTAHDRDWYAVKLVAGSVYRIDLEGSETGAGTLADPFLRGVHDAQGRLITGTADDDGGEGLNARLEFTAGETGIHYVAAGAHGGGTGAYALSVRELLGEGEIRAAVASAAPLEVGGLARARIDGAGDRDWFAVELVAGTVYRIGIEGSEAGGGTLLDPWLRGIHGPDGRLLAGTADDDGEGLGGGVEFAARETGTHYVVAGAGGDGTGAYTLSAVAVAGDVPAGVATTATVEVGGTATGELEAAHDRDWYAVELEAGVTYRIDLEGSETGVGTLADPFLHGIHDADGILIPGTTDDDGGAGLDSRLEFTARETGTHYIAAGGHGPGAGAYRLTVATAGEAEAGEAGAEPLDQEVQEGAPDTRQTAQQRSETPETKEANEEDTEDTEDTIVLVPPVVVTGGAATQTMEQAQESVPDTTQAARQQSGPPETDEEDTEDTVVLAPPLVESVPPLADADDGEGSPLVAEEQNTDDHPADTTTTSTVDVSGRATGDIEFPGDRDWFAVDFVADTTYRIDLKGRSTDDGTLPDPYLHGVHDPAGKLIPGTADDDGGYGGNSWKYFTATESGTHFIEAGGTGTGTYTLSVAAVTDDHPASTSTTATVADGGSATGVVDFFGDRDWFAVQLEAGATYRIDLKGRSTDDGTLHNPWLRGIHDAQGDPIAGTDDDNGGEGRNSRLEFTATETGTHYVSAGGYGAGTGTYSLEVAEVL